MNLNMIDDMLPRLRQDMILSWQKETDKFPLQHDSDLREGVINY